MIAKCALLKCYTILQHRDSSVNIPLPPDQHHCSNEAKWRMGVVWHKMYFRIYLVFVVAHISIVVERADDI